MTTTLHDWASQYAARGFPVLPAVAGKKMPCKGLKHADATTDPEMIRLWFDGDLSRYAGAELMVRLPPDVIVIDLDVKGDDDGFRDFTERHGLRPDRVSSPMFSTPSGGLHMLFRTGGRDFKQTVRLDGSAIDIRTGWDFVPCGKSGREWIKGLDVPLAVVPDWVLPRPVREEAPPGERRERTGTNSRYGAAALEMAYAAIASAVLGTQSITLNRESFSIGQLVAGGELDPAEARDLLIEAGFQMTNGDPRNPWTMAAITEVVEKAMSDAERSPRNAPAAEAPPTYEHYDEPPPYDQPLYETSPYDDPRYGERPMEQLELKQRHREQNKFGYGAWCRLYSKLNRYLMARGVRDAIRATFHDLMCHAIEFSRDSGEVPSPEKFAQTVPREKPKMHDRYNVLIREGVLTRSDGKYFLVEWKERQPATPTERTQKRREGQKAV
jgi:Bifunctional DNA primase/polymerase, N-terminal